jgi:PTS system nitrogen regulatory IIA component
MTDLSDLLVPEAVLAGVTAVNKKALFQQLGAAAARAYGLDAKLVAERLAEREKLGSTGFGGGIAIPHGRLDGLDHIVAVFATMAQPVDFAAVDDLPVDLVFMLLSPVAAGADHLKALASVSRRLRDRNFAAKLRGAGSTDALFALLAGVEARDAA